MSGGWWYLCRWRFERWWFSGPGPRVVASAAALVMLAAVVALAVAARELHREDAALSQELARLRAGMPLSPPAAFAPTADFTSRLPAGIDTEFALAVVAHSAGNAGVLIAAQQLSETPASPERLGRAELVLSAHGAYASLKQWLATLMGRLPYATVSQLELKHNPGTPHIEARLTLVLWSQPQPGGAALPR